MRFLGGLIFGTFLVLVASLYFDTSAVESESGTKTELSSAPMSEPTQHTALNSIEPAMPVPAPAPVPTPPSPRKTDSGSALESSVAKDSVAEVPAPEAGPHAAHADTNHKQPQEPEQFEFDNGAKPESAQALAANSTPGQSDPFSSPDAAPIEQAPAPTDLPEVIESTTVSVWQPFHSEVSAKGFAKRLSLQLGYPFSVIKAGPAEYHVVFQYTAESERDLLSAQLATLTGAAPQ